VSTIAARCRPLIAGFAALSACAAFASPASAAPAPATTGCPDVAVTQPFAPWGDAADYFLAPNGGLERGASGWALRGDAELQKGNEPFYVVDDGDRRSLSLSAGSSATTASFCIGVEHRSMRFFADGSRSSSLDVDVLYSDDGGRERSMRLATLSGSGRWAPTDVVPMIVNAMAAERDNALSVRLRFTPRARGDWSIDDVLVDPYRSR
jgi:hypothetical protein